MTPKCCEKCDHKNKEHCGSFKTCEAWLSWFKEQWDDIRASAAEIRENKPEKKRAKAKSSRGLCTYATDPAAAMEYPGKVGAK